MSGITKTIPQKEGIAAVEALYEGQAGEYEFHMAGKPSRLNVGDYVYTIWQDMLVGRCQIIRIEGGAVNPQSGELLWGPSYFDLLFIKICYRYIIKGN